MLIGTNNWNVEIYRNKLKKRKWIIAFVWQKARYFLLSVSGIRIHIFLKWVSKTQSKCSLGIAQFPYCFFHGKKFTRVSDLTFFILDKAKDSYNPAAVSKL